MSLGGRLSKLTLAAVTALVVATLAVVLIGRQPSATPRTSPAAAMQDPAGNEAAKAASRAMTFTQAPERQK